MAKWSRLKAATDYKTIAMVALLLIVVLVFYVVMHSLAQRDDAINAAKAKDQQIASLTNDVQGLQHQIGVLANQLRKHGIKPKVVVKHEQGTSTTVVVQPTSQPQPVPQPQPAPSAHPSSHPSSHPTHSPRPRPTPSPTRTPSPPPHGICVPFTKICTGDLILLLVRW